MADVKFPCNPKDLDELLAYLTQVREEHGNMPLGSYVMGANGYLEAVTVFVGKIGLSKGPARLVSRGGRECLVIG